MSSATLGVMVPAGVQVASSKPGDASGGSTIEQSTVGACIISHPWGDGPGAPQVASSNQGAASGGGVIKPCIVAAPLWDRTLILHVSDGVLLGHIFLHHLHLARHMQEYVHHSVIHSIRG